MSVHPLPPLLHNQPHLIADEVRGLATALLLQHRNVAVAYADCGTYGALDVLRDGATGDHRDRVRPAAIILRGSRGGRRSGR